MLTEKQRSSYELRLQQAFAAAMAAHSRVLLGLLGVPPNMQRVPAAFWQGLDGSLTRALEPVLAEMATASAQGLGAQAGISSSVNWDLVNQRAATWAADYSYSLVRGIDNTTKAMLQNAIRAFEKTPGMDLKALAAGIEPRIPALLTKLGGMLTSADRASMIAITEATRAAAQGEEMLLGEIQRLNPSVVMVQIWATSVDEYVCSVCAPLNGKVRGDGWDDPPPAHPRCRCALLTALPGLGGVFG